MLPDVPGTWNRAPYKDKLSALKKYMHLTPNSDAIPDCALHNRSGIMRQKGRRGAVKSSSSLSIAPHSCLLPLAGSSQRAPSTKHHYTVKRSTGKHFRALSGSDSAICLAAANDSQLGVAHTRCGP